MLVTVVFDGMVGLLCAGGGVCWFMFSSAACRGLGGLVLISFVLCRISFVFGLMLVLWCLVCVGLVVLLVSLRWLYCGFLGSGVWLLAGFLGVGGALRPASFSFACVVWFGFWFCFLDFICGGL